MYNNAKPVFEVSGKSVLAGPNCLDFLLKFLPGNSEYDCAYYSGDVSCQPAGGGDELRMKQ